MKKNIKIAALFIITFIILLFSVSCGKSELKKNENLPAKDILFKAYQNTQNSVKTPNYENLLSIKNKFSEDVSCDAEIVSGSEKTTAYIASDSDNGFSFRITSGEYKLKGFSDAEEMAIALDKAEDNNIFSYGFKIKDAEEGTEKTKAFGKLFSIFGLPENVFEIFSNRSDKAFGGKFDSMSREEIFKAFCDEINFEKKINPDNTADISFEISGEKLNEYLTLLLPEILISSEKLPSYENSIKASFRINENMYIESASFFNGESNIMNFKLKNNKDSIKFSFSLNDESNYDADLTISNKDKSMSFDFTEKGKESDTVSSFVIDDEGNFSFSENGFYKVKGTIKFIDEEFNISASLFDEDTENTTEAKLSIKNSIDESKRQQKFEYVDIFSLENFDFLRFLGLMAS